MTVRKIEMTENGPHANCVAKSFTSKRHKILVSPCRPPKCSLGDGLIPVRKLHFQEQQCCNLTTCIFLCLDSNGTNTTIAMNTYLTFLHNKLAHNDHGNKPIQVTHIWLQTCTSNEDNSNASVLQIPWCYMFLSFHWLQVHVYWPAKEIQHHWYHRKHRSISHDCNDVFLLQISILW